MKVQFETLFWQIFNCEGENQVHEIVISDELLKSPKNWYPYGGKSKDDRSNFGTFENQQDNSGAALVEKITNSIDALLLKKCKQRGIDPKSQDAPATMEDAADRFFDIPQGELGELLPTDRTKLALDNIQIIATGEKGRPDLMIWDNGEGQHPDDFKDTFLSIANNNKTDISFVQGKYNMGSTGAVLFCGEEHRYQLISSKKNNEIFGKNSKHVNNLFGWTLVRRHVLSDEEGRSYGSTWYEYFAVGGENIPQFEIEILDIGLDSNVQFNTGSFIKLFSYELPHGARTSIHIGLYRVLNQLLYKPSLPIHLHESRKSFIRSRKNYPVYGNHVRINLDAQQNLEIPTIYEKFTHKDIGEVSIQVAIFKKDVEERQYIGSKNLIFIQNGQVQGHEGQSFITQDLKYNFLKKSMLVVVDCTSIKTQYRQDLFMANRSNMRESQKLAKLRDEVIEILKSNEQLKKLNTDRKNAILQGGDEKKAKALIESLLSQVPLDESLTKLLKRGMDLVNLKSQINQIKNKGKEDKKRPRETKRFPSIFKINLPENGGKKIKSIPLNGKGIIQFETDVDEDYFYRPKEKGEFHLKILDRKNKNDEKGGTGPGKPNRVEDAFEVNQSGPADGSIKLTLKPQQNLDVGDEIKLNARMTSPDGDKEVIFYVKIADPKKQDKNKTDKEPEKPDLPKLIKINKNEKEEWVQDNGQTWDNDGDWGEKSVIKVIADSEKNKSIVSAIAVNMDSHSLKRYLSKNSAKNEKDIDYLKNQYISKVYLHGLFLYSILEKLKIEKNKNNKYAKEDQDSEELLAKIFENYSDVLLYLDTNKEIINSLED